MSDSEQEMFFFIADISGYTSYMIKNKEDLTHGSLIVVNLMETLIKEANFPFEISKLEGDAMFIYLLKDKLSSEFKNDPYLLGAKVLKFFDVFFYRLWELQSSATCSCGGCANIDQLNLKIIAHYGKAVICNIGSFKELSGVDVIIAHRLLKNQVKEKHYLLMTTPAHERMKLPPEGKTVEGEEMDKDLGPIPVYTYFPASVSVLSRPSKPMLGTFRMHIMMKGNMLLRKLGLKKVPKFLNFPQEAHN